MTVAVASPQGYRPRDEVVDTARRLAEASGGAVEILENPVEAVQGADAVYTDVWVSMSDDESSAAARREALAAYAITDELLAHANPDAFAAAMTDFIRDPAVVRRMGINGARHCQKFSWDEYVSRIDDYIDNIPKRN